MGYPSFRLYRSGGTDREQLDFTGPRDLENFIRFVKTEHGAERREEL